MLFSLRSTTTTRLHGNNRKSICEYFTSNVSLVNSPIKLTERKCEIIELALIRMVFGRL